MKTAIVLLGILVAIAAGVLSFFGLFATVNIQEKEMGPYLFIMKKYVGPYRNVGKVMEDMYNDLKNSEIETSKGLGIYYDDPKVTPDDKTRSVVGYTLEGLEPLKIMEMEKKYSLGELPRTSYLVVEFPFKGLPSIIIGVYRVYPKIARYLKDNDLPRMPIVELYESKAQKMYYIVPINVNPYIFERLLDKAGS